MAQNQQQLSKQVVKTTTATTMGGSLAVLCGLTLTGTVIALVLATPLLIIFSPVLVPAAITIFLIAAGFVASDGFGSAAVFVLYWLHNYITGKKPVKAEKLDKVRQRITGAATELKDRTAKQLGLSIAHLRKSGREVLTMKLAMLCS